MKTFLFVLLAINGGRAFAGLEVKEFPLSEVSSIEVYNTSGDVHINAVDSGLARVTADKRVFGSTCEIAINKKSKVLFVEVKNTSMLSETCEVDLTIRAPKTANLDLHAGSGDVHVKGIAGDLAFTVGSGSVNVDGGIKKLDGRSGSGDVSIKGLTAGGSLKTGSGKIDLAFKVAPVVGELDIKSGSGDADITFPKSAKVRTNFSAGSGSLTNELGDSPESKFQLSVLTGSGDLRIKKE